MTTPMPQVWYLSFFDSEGDDRRGTSDPRAEDYGCWLDRNKAQARADELNRGIASGLRRARQDAHAAALRQWNRKRKDFLALVAAGRRSGEFDEPEPSLDLLAKRSWRGGIEVDGVRIDNYWDVDSYDLNDAPTEEH